MHALKLNTYHIIICKQEDQNIYLKNKIAKGTRKACDWIFLDFFQRRQFLHEMKKPFPLSFRTKKLEFANDKPHPYQMLKPRH